MSQKGVVKNGVCVWVEILDHQENELTCQSLVRKQVGGTLGWFPTRHMKVITQGGSIATQWGPHPLHSLDTKTIKGNTMQLTLARLVIYKYSCRRNMIAYTHTPFSSLFYFTHFFQHGIHCFILSWWLDVYPIRIHWKCHHCTKRLDRSSTISGDGCCTTMYRWRVVAMGWSIFTQQSNQSCSRHSKRYILEHHQTKNNAWRLTPISLAGRLRLIQETEICLYDAKPVEEAHNQLWGVREGIMDALGRQQPGNVIYSLSNDDWVLDIHSNPENGTCKLILFPFQAVDNDFQLWTFVNENDKEQLDMAPAIKNTLPSSTIPSSEAEMYSQGLSPAKRGSQSSVTMLSLDAYRECHQMVYLERNPRLR